MQITGERAFRPRGGQSRGSLVGLAGARAVGGREVVGGEER